MLFKVAMIRLKTMMRLSGMWRLMMKKRKWHYKTQLIKSQTEPLTNQTCFTLSQMVARIRSLTWKAMAALQLLLLSQESRVKSQMTDSILMMMKAWAKQRMARLIMMMMRKRTGVLQKRGRHKEKRNCAIIKKIQSQSRLMSKVSSRLSHRSPS